MDREIKGDISLNKPAWEPHGKILLNFFTIVYLILNIVDNWQVIDEIMVIIFHDKKWKTSLSFSSTSIFEMKIFLLFTEIKAECIYDNAVDVVMLEWF